MRFSAQTDRWGNAYVGVTPVKEWEHHQEEGTTLVKEFDELYETFKSKSVPSNN